MESALGRDLKSAYTKTLKKLDGKRDAAFKFLRKLIVAFLDSPVPEQKTGSEMLMEYIYKHGYRLHAKGYAEQTSLTRHLFDDFNKSESQDALEKINAKPQYQALIDTQKEFEDNYNEKLEIESKENIPPTKYVRRNLVRNLNSIIYVMNIHIEHVPETYDDFAKQIDDVGIDLMTIAKARMTRKNNEEEETE